MLNNAYLKHRFKNITIVSGTKLMPLDLQLDENVIRVINLMGSGLFPLCLCMLLPVFLYQIVLEKETRLLEVMKMNGLRMRYYWFVNTVFNFVYYIIQCLIFLLFGRYGLGLQFFIEESYVFLAIFLVGWGLCQISLSFFFSACI